MNAILSIKPYFAELILSGYKKYEYRKSIFKRPVNKVLMYASSPVCKIVGEFMIEDVISGSPEEVWRLTGEHSGISYEFYDSYFKLTNQAYALKISSLKMYDTPVNPYIEIEGFKAPQSFCYTEMDFDKRMFRRSPLQENMQNVCGNCQNID